MADMFDGSRPRGAGAADGDRLLEALAAADPARDASADLVAVRARVAQLKARDQQGAGGSADPGHDVSEDLSTSPSSAAASTTPVLAVEGNEPHLVALAAGYTSTAAARRRRSTRFMGVAAAVVGALVVAGVSYSFGVSRGPFGDGPDSASALADAAPIVLPPAGTAPRLTAAELQAEAMGGASATRDSGTSRAGGPGAAAGPDGSASTDAAGRTLSAPARAWAQNRFVFHDGGLSTTAGKAEGWTLDARTAYTAKTAARVARALSIEGDAVQQYGAWTVGASDGSSASVSVYTDGSVWFSDPARDVDKGRAPSASRVTGQAEAFLGSLDLDPAGFRLTLDTAQEDGSPYAGVTAYQLLDGTPSGLSWSLSVTREGVASASGSLATPVTLGRYDIVSPAQAFHRLTDPRFSASVWPSAYPASVRAEEDAAPTEAPAVAAPSVPPLATPGQRLEWPVADVTVSEADLGLSTYYAADGAAMLLPTYQLRTSDGGAWAVIAVADDELTF